MDTNQGQGINGDHYPAKVEGIKQGEYVRRKVDARTTYIRRTYDVSTKRYLLEAADDMNRWVEVKKGTVLFVGFTY